MANLHRLAALVNYTHNLDPEKLRMGLWKSGVPGSQCCLVGNYTDTDQAKKDGLTPTYESILFDKSTGMEAAIKYFEITAIEASYLFMPTVEGEFLRDDKILYKKFYQTRLVEFLDRQIEQAQAIQRERAAVIVEEMISAVVQNSRELEQV